MATCGPSESPNAKQISGLKMSTYSVKEFTVLLTGGQMKTGKYDRSKGKVPLGQITGETILRNH